MGSKIYELKPTNGRKSFCGKAKVIFSNGVRYLMSYDTIMGSTDANGVPHRYSGHYSATTNNHVRAFFGANVDFWGLPLENCPTIAF